MTKEWRQNNAHRRAWTGLALFIGILLVVIIVAAAGVKSIPTIAVLGITIAAGIGVFLLLWGLEDMR